RRVAPVAGLASGSTTSAIATTAQSAPRRRRRMTRTGHLPPRPAPPRRRVLKPSAETADIRGDMRNRDREPQTKIRATCPPCGDVELTPPDVELHVCTAAERSYYAFACP